MDFLLFIFMSLCAGSAFFMMKVAAQAFDPIVVAVARMTIGAILLTLLYLIRRKPLGISPSQVPFLIFYALIADALPFALLPYIIKLLDNSSVVGLMTIFGPLFVLLFSIPVLKVKPSWREALGTIGGLLCLIFLFRDSILKGMKFQDLLLAGFLPVSYAIAVLLIRKGFRQADTLGASMASLWVAIFWLMPFLVMKGTLPSYPLPALPSAVILFLGVFPTALVTWAGFYLIAKKGPLYMSMANYIIPFVALFWGWWDGEPVGIFQMVILVMTGGMVWLVQGQKLEAEQANR